MEILQVIKWRCASWISILEAFLHHPISNNICCKSKVIVKVPEPTSAWLQVTERTRAYLTYLIHHPFLREWLEADWLARKNNATNSGWPRTLFQPPLYCFLGCHHLLNSSSWILMVVPWARLALPASGALSRTNLDLPCCPSLDPLAPTLLILLKQWSCYRDLSWQWIAITCPWSSKGIRIVSSSGLLMVHLTLRTSLI